MPLSVFQKHKIFPQQGMIFSFDGLFGKVISSGTRVIVDFNNPLSGKDVIYELNLKRKITDLQEKIKALMSAFFKQEFEFKIEEKKLILKTKPEIKKFVELFKAKYDWGRHPDEEANLPYVLSELAYKALKSKYQGGNSI